MQKEQKKAVTMAPNDTRPAESPPENTNNCLRWQHSVVRRQSRSANARITLSQTSCTPLPTILRRHQSIETHGNFFWRKISRSSRQQDAAFNVGEKTHARQQQADPLSGKNGQ
jgi:hypothetical protein